MSKFPPDWTYVVCPEFVIMCILEVFSIYVRQADHYGQTYRKVECDLLTRPFSVGVETRPLMGLHPVGESDCSRGPDEQT